MTWSEFDVWSSHSRRGFAAQQVAAGLAREPEASAHAERVFADLLPDGLATPTHLFWTAHVDDGPALGHLWMRVRPLSTEVEAFVFDVEVVASCRGRGLGRAAMEAAESSARALGGTVMRLNVFGHNTAALRLYDRLGYQVASTTMTRRLEAGSAVGSTAGSTTGPAVELIDMTEQEYADLRPTLEAGCAGSLARAGVLPVTEAARTVREDLARLLPQGPASSGHRLWTAYDGSVPVGRVWLQLQHRSDGLHAFAHHLEVRADLRRRGYGRSVLLATERACRRLGVRSVALSVLGFDAGGRSLYGRSGFEVTAQTRTKRL
jgi:ribosomal protein S18 acetylase RimI-like enzyme